jgi:hypothetical protein
LVAPWSLGKGEEREVHGEEAAGPFELVPEDREVGLCEFGWPGR